MGRGVSDEEWAPIWEELESQGWRFEAVAGQQYFLPPGAASLSLSLSLSLSAYVRACVRL